MKILASIIMIALQLLISHAEAAEFSEKVMCAASNKEASFARISLQIDPRNSKRGLLILSASDGWTQVYSGSIAETSKTVSFSEDKQIITASFNKGSLTARQTFSNDRYLCDERSFGG